MSTDTTFAALGVPTRLVTVLDDLGITVPTPIQAATLRDSIAGRNVLGRGRTGSGKTYAFLLPLLTRLAASGGRRQSRRPRALVLAPTRELATQIDTAMAPLAKALGLTSQTIFGGVGANPQIKGLRDGVDVIVACPGRLEDLMSQGHVSLDGIEVTVLDEADHMADLGFLPGVRRILEKTPGNSQRLLFSATLDGAINVIVKRFLTNPVTHEADSAQSPVSTMSHHVLHVDTAAHLPVIVDLAAAPGRKVVFTRTKHRAKKLARQLNASGVPAVELHGNLSQGARTRNLDDFHSGRAQTLVATDIAARGIHVDDVALVIHADPPVEHKAYLHRSGRTARAGNDGTVVTMMLDDQVRDVRDLTRQAGIKPTTTRVALGHPLLAELAPGERSFSGALVREVASSATGDAAASGGARAGGRGRGRNRARGQSAPKGQAQGPRQGQGSGRSRQAQSGGGQAATGQPSGQAGRRRGGPGRRGGASTVYSTSSAGSAASFSAGTRVGTRRGR